MALKVIGAGLGRTGTNSLKLALEELLGAPCYHMLEVFQHPEDVPVWNEAYATGKPDFDRLMDGYAAAVDWPFASFWRQAMDAYPEGVVLLSLRDPEEWYASATATIFNASQNPDVPDDWRTMVKALFGGFTPDLTDKAATIAAFNAHNETVKKTVPAGRLVVWQPGDGWEPICKALGIAVPATPFPHTNTREQFQERAAARQDSD